MKKSLDMSSLLIDLILDGYEIQHSQKDYLLLLEEWSRRYWERRGGNGNGEPTLLEEDGHGNGPRAPYKIRHGGEGPGSRPEIIENPAGDERYYLG